MQTLLRQAVFLVLVLMGPAACTTQGQESACPVRLTLDLSDGSRLIGTPTQAAFMIDTYVGRLVVPLTSVSSMTFRDAPPGVVVALTNGDRLTGTCDLGALRLATLLGEVSVDLRFVRKLACSATGGGLSGRRGLVLWNRLESENEVNASRVGPGATMTAGRFVSGRFGNGVEVGLSDGLAVTFPSSVLSRQAGCLEFWAKFVDFPTDMGWGQRPALVAVCDAQGDENGGPLLHLNGNDGASNGGVCASVGGFGSAGTGTYGTWTYRRALAGGDPNDWHHYALVWNVAGLPEVADGTHAYAVFVDGRLNTGSWQAGTPDPAGLALPEAGRFGFLTHQQTMSGSVVYDNLKVWNYAKTDFSDRNEE